jgi:phosphoglycerol transferase MdoB-like AlkP superfamily enzyme
MNSVDRPLELPPLLQLLLLLFVVFAVGRRAKLSGGISLAPPAFVPLASDAGSRFAREFGTAYAELIEAEQRRGQT